LQTSVFFSNQFTNQKEFDMKKISHYIISLLLLFSCSYAIADQFTPIPPLIDPAVTFKNASSQAVYVVWYADLAGMQQVKKYADIISARKDNFTLKDGITYYARANSQGSGLTQNNIVHVTVYDDATQKKLLGAATYNLATYSQQPIQNDKKILLKVTITPNFAIHISDKNMAG